MDEIQVLRRWVRVLLALFMVGLLVSGLTAFPLEWELGMLQRLVGQSSTLGAAWPGLAQWITLVQQGLQHTNHQYPFIAYGTDWLAFAHIVITIAFIGPLRDPVRNVWVIEFGMIACALVLPLALIMGPLRGIPFFWQLIDCSFGVVGIVPLWLCRRLVKRIELMQVLDRGQGCAQKL